MPVNNKREEQSEEVVYAKCSLPADSGHSEAPWSSHHIQMDTEQASGPQ